MKSLRESLTEVLESNSGISYKKFKKDVEDIIKDAGLTISKDKIKANPIVLYSNHEADNTYSYGANASNIDEYTFIYTYENGSAQKYGYNTNIAESFQLKLCLWFDKELNRPRYKFINFYLKYPESLGGGYDTQSSWLTFVSKKIDNEFYELAIKNIKQTINAFTHGRETMDKAWEMNGSKKLIKSDFLKVVKGLFGGILKEYH